MSESERGGGGGMCSWICGNQELVLGRAPSPFRAQRALLQIFHVLRHGGAGLFWSHAWKEI